MKEIRRGTKEIKFAQPKKEKERGGLVAGPRKRVSCS
jgi:hypothetical protein